MSKLQATHKLEVRRLLDAVKAYSASSASEKSRRAVGEAQKAFNDQSYRGLHLEASWTRPEHAPGWIYDKSQNQPRREVMYWLLQVIVESLEAVGAASDDVAAAVRELELAVLDGLEPAEAAVVKAWRWTASKNPGPWVGLQDDQVAEASGSDPELEDRYRVQIDEGSYAVPDKVVVSKSRGSAQKVFANTVKSNYGWRCAVTGIGTKEFLVASHIVPWSEDESIRLDPTNGICLSTFVDRAFDAAFLSITPGGKTAVRWERVLDDASLEADLRRIDQVCLALPSAAPPDPLKLERRYGLGY